MISPDRQNLGPAEVAELHAGARGDRNEPPEPRFFFSEEVDGGSGGSSMLLHFGPQHPATRGTLRAVLKVDGERIVDADAEIGYVHTGFEKLGEHLNYQQWVTVTDRMNYMSAMNNNVGYAIACEALFGVTPPRRAQVLRVILCELSRIADHILCAGLTSLDLGAASVGVWAFERREKIYDIMEVVTGSRLTTSYTRIGGLLRDVEDKSFRRMVQSVLDEFPSFLEELREFTAGNGVFESRLRGIGVIAGDEAISWGLTGPILRATGVAHDIRKREPYSGYERYDFDIPVQQEGDSWSRFVQRLDEIDQSLEIIEQALADLEPGPVHVDGGKIASPAKAEDFDSIESFIHHSKQSMLGHGILPPRGAEVYSATEAPNGELGFYLVSDGEMNAYRTRVRPPSLYHFAIFPRLVRRLMLGDAVAVLSTLNVIAGELDR